ncbi:MAG: polymerase [Thermoleophilia bacterium]|nr:polymerase [Thermoleophilia bacterium]
MRNVEIADAFAELADRLALQDEKPYRYMAYRRAATTFRELGDSVQVLSEEGRLREIDGVGDAIEEKVRSLLATGSFPALDRAREQVPESLLALTRLPGVGASTARKVHAALDGESFESLLERAAAGTLPTGDGVTKKVVDALANEAARRAAGGGSAGAGSSGVPRGEDGEPLPGPWIRRDQAAALLETIAELLPDGVRDPHPSGAYVRGLELVQGVTVVAVADDPQAAAAQVADLVGSRAWERSAPDTPRLPVLADVPPEQVVDLQLVSPAGIPVVIAVASPEGADLALHRLAGPGAWVALESTPRPGGSVPYELRDRVLAGGMALEDVPADLVTAADLRGELHAHSDWSDGRATILDMARAARDRGDEFFNVTDHSAPYTMVGGLDPDRIHAQADEIRAANEQLQREHEEDGEPLLRVLRGTELEILADGSLGLPDAILRELDWVVASLHVQQGQSAADVKERMRRVVENPLVDSIGHPTSRKLLVRERTALDVEWLVEAAAATHLVLEINADPNRLDLDSEQAAMALAAGVRLTVNTDAHRTRTLAYRDHGVAVARRAGARVGDVVNCLPVEELLAGRRRHR